MKTKSAWLEYDSAAEWCAKRGIKGKQGDWLPANLSAECVALITDDLDAFEQRVRDTGYKIAMEKINEN
jgi:hypothetical protein